MDKGPAIAKLEGILDEITARANVSETRKTQMNYFLDGIRTEAREMSSSAQSAEWQDAVYTTFRIILRPFEETIKNRIAVLTGKSFSAAKGVYDNLNRFLQVAYLPETEIESRAVKVAGSPKDVSSAYRAAYNLKDIEGSSLENATVQRFRDATEGKSLVQTVRNASDHGSKHILVSKSRRMGYGFALSDEIVKGETLSEIGRQLPIVLDTVQLSYLANTASILDDYLETLPRPTTFAEKAKLIGKKIKHQCLWNFHLLKKVIIPVAAATVLLGVVDSGVTLKKHRDEQSKRQLVDFAQFEKNISRVQEQEQALQENKAQLIEQYNILMSYSNKPASFNAESVSNALEELGDN